MSSSLTNRAIAHRLETHGRLLQAAGESAFRARAYTRAAEALRNLEEPVSQIWDQGRLREIPGVGEGIAIAISQLLETGEFEAHSALTSAFPESILELMAIPGVGARTAMKLHAALGIVDLETLEAAVQSGKIANTKGLGPRAEATIIDGLATLRRRTGRTPLGVALPVARHLVTAYARARPSDTISVAGSARRWEVTVGDLDFVLATGDQAASIAALGELSAVESIERTAESVVRLGLDRGLSADVYLTEPAAFGTTLLRATGNEEHLRRLGALPEHAPSEEAIYAARGLPWIPPELRQGDEEFARPGAIASLVQVDDINGEFHAHTTWSDGGASIEEMAEAASRRGYSFLGITDHSHGLGVAGGLDAERLAQQRIELDAASGLAGVTLLAGAEVEVHRDGRLDFDDEILARLNVVVASLHTGLRQPRDEITSRLIRVLENPHVDIIAHPSGRLIERREGGDFDWNRVFPVAARTGTAMEINADPARLDLDPTLARDASAAGCLITVNCDAHRPEGFDVMEYGIAMARRAWLAPEKILNCWPREEVLGWLAARGQAE